MVAKSVLRFPKATTHFLCSIRYPGSSIDQGPYEISVVSSQPSTLVNVTLSGPSPVSLTFDGVSYSNGDSIMFTLQQLETAQVAEDFFLSLYSIKPLLCCLWSQ